MAASYIIAVSGGSCSGKTTFCKRLQEKMGEDRCSILLQDNYYIDQSHRFDEDGGAVNYDHPDAIEFSLLCQHLESLRRGEAIEVPLYDFTRHARRTETLFFPVSPVTLVDGILILSQPELLPVFDYSIFIECDSQRRFQRRLQRDTIERGRSPEGVKAQFEKQVEPMHQKFVEPSKKFADRVLSQEDYLQSAEQYMQELIDQVFV